MRQDHGACASRRRRSGWEKTLGFATALAAVAVLASACSAEPRASADGAAREMSRGLDASVTSAAAETAAARQPLLPGHEGTLPDRPPWRIAVASMLGPATTFDSYRGILEAIASRTHRGYELIQRRTYREVDDLLQSGQLDLAFICSGTYAAMPVEAVELLAAAAAGDAPEFHAVLVVPADSPARAFSDLAGKRLVFTDPLSFTGFIYGAHRAYEAGASPESYFASTFFAGSHERAMDALVQGLADGAYLSDVVYHKLVSPPSSYWNRLRVIESSAAYPSPPVVSPTSVPAADRAELRRVLLELGDTPEGAAVLARIGVRKFVAIDPHAYDGIREMMEVTAGRAK